MTLLAPTQGASQDERADFSTQPFEHEGRAYLLVHLADTNQRWDGVIAVDDLYPELRGTPDRYVAPPVSESIVAVRRSRRMLESLHRRHRIRSLPATFYVRTLVRRSRRALFSIRWTGTTELTEANPIPTRDSTGDEAEYVWWYGSPNEVRLAGACCSRNQRRPHWW